MRYLTRVLVSGSIASAASALAAAAASRIENRHAARPMNAIAHIHDGGPPAARDRGGRNTFVGFVIHTAASLWWALFFEALPRRQRERLGTGAIAAMAFLVDYGVVPPRLRPGFERHLSSLALLAVYGALAAGFAAAAPLERRLDHHQEEDGDERDERRPAERGPDAVIAPEARRQRLA